MTIVLFAVCTFSCAGNNIPEEVNLDEASRTLVSDYCKCYLETESKSDCYSVYKKKFKAALLERYKDERTAFVKNVVHALIECDCEKQLISDQDIHEMVEELNRFSNE